MKSLLFILNFYSTYIPKEPEIFFIILCYLKSKSVKTEEDIIKRLNYIESNINDNDYKLMHNFYISQKGYPSIIDYLKSDFKRIITGDKIFKQLVDNELTLIRCHNNDIDKGVPNLFKYYLPITIGKEPYQRFKAEMYYLIRTNLMDCNNKSDILKKLNHDSQFRQYIADTIIKIDNKKQISNINKFYESVDKLFLNLIINVNKPKFCKIENLRKWNIYVKSICKDFGFDKKDLTIELTRLNK